MLQRLIRDPELQGWLESEQLLAGTSTGGLISLGLANGVTIDKIRDLYEKRGPIIFQDTLLDNIKDLGNVLGAQYNIEPLELEVRNIVGDTKLKQLRKNVMITAFDLDNDSADPTARRWKPKIFHNFLGGDTGW